MRRGGGGENNKKPLEKWERKEKLYREEKIQSMNFIIMLRKNILRGERKNEKKKRLATKIKCFEGNFLRLWSFTITAREKVKLQEF